MANLADTQQQLFNYLQGRPSSIESLVSGKTPAAVKRRLLIYRDAYQLRLHAHLAKQFPVLRAYLREAAFEALTSAYREAYPPQHFAIRGYGDHLSDFLKQEASYPAYLSDLALVEWQLNEIVDQSASAPLLQTEHLATLNPQDLPRTRFHLQAYVRFIHIDYEIPPWRDALKKTSKKLAPPPRLAQAKTYALWRKGWQSYYRAVSDLEWRLAEAIPQGADFNTLCTLALDAGIDEQQAAACVAQTLLTWIRDGWFTEQLTLNDE